MSTTELEPTLKLVRFSSTSVDIIRDNVHPNLPQQSEDTLIRTSFHSCFLT